MLTVMKKLVRPCFAVLLMLLFQVVSFAQNGHNSILFNTGWKFHKGDLDTTKRSINTTAWRSIELPHDWSAEGPFSQQWASGTAFAPTGIGWYSKKFNLTVKSGLQTFIYFDGVYSNSEVWINGHFLGKRPSGFISFQYELTKYLKTSGQNELLVKVDHSQFADSRWYTGSGIYRNVYLITTNPVHIGLWGVAFTTPKITDAIADAKVSVSIVNNSSITTGLVVKSNLIDPSGKIISSDSRALKINREDTMSVALSFKVHTPRLWSVEKPNLYQLAITVTADGKVVDQWREKVGFRDVRFDPNEGFFLNGRNMKLKGVCLHDDAGVLGVAVPKEVWSRRLKIMQAAGVNSVRMAHNPHADYLYDLCDELGLLVMDETYDEWEGGKNKWIKGWNQGKPGKDGPHEYFKEWATRDIADMVLRGRNHASIIMWSIGNEIDYPGDPYIDVTRTPTADHPSAARLGEVSKILVAAIKQHDLSRPVTSALAGVEMSNKTTYPGNLDIVGYNYQESRYEKDHKTYPERIIYGSENSKKLEAWLAVEKNKFISGQYLWTGIDYLGEAHDWPDHASSNGLTDMAGFPKAEYYFRQSLWLETPMVQIATTELPTAKNPDPYPKQGQPNWNYAAGERKRVNCFTNCPQAELFLNGVSLGKKKLADFSNKVITWDVDYKPGQLTIKGYTKEGKTIAHSLRTVKAAYAINAKADVVVLNKNVRMAHVIVSIVDKDGLPVVTADNEVTIAIEGPARLLGIENGALNSMEDYRSPTKKVLRGKLLAYIQSKGTSGPIKITVKSPGLQPKSITIQSGNK